MLEGNNSTRIIDTSTAHRVASGLGLWLCRDGHAPSARKIADARLRRQSRLLSDRRDFGLIRPLRQAGILPADYPVTVNAVSGYTGGGKQMIAQMEDPRAIRTISPRRISSMACR